MAINGSFTGDTFGGFLKLRVVYSVVYNNTTNKYDLTATPYLDHTQRIATSNAHTGSITITTNAGATASVSFTSGTYDQSGTGSVKLSEAVTVSIAGDSITTLTPSASYNLNAPSLGVSTLTANGAAVNVARPSVSNASVGTIGTTSAGVSVTSGYSCDLWQYRLGTSGSWSMLSTATATTATGTVSGLSVGTTYSNLYVRVRRADMQNYSNPYNVPSFTTLGKGFIKNATDVEIDAVSPSVTLTFDIYNTSYGYTLSMWCGETPLAYEMTVTFSATGTQTKTFNMASYKSDIFAEMPTSTSVPITYVLTTTIGNNGYTDSLDGVAYVTATNSAPTWATTPVFTLDSRTGAFWDDHYTDITYGLIKNVTTVSVVTNNIGASAVNGATISHYYLSVGGVLVTSTATVIRWNAKDTLSGTQTDVIFGIVDSRGFEKTISYVAPLYDYTPVYWQTTDMHRNNGYDNQIVLNVAAKYYPLSVTTHGSTYTNVADTDITYKYSLDNGTTWSSSYTISATDDTTNYLIEYSGSPNALNIDNTKNVRIRITARDSLSESMLDVTVPNGVPLIRFEDGKITINGDLIVNGTITQNP